MLVRLIAFMWFCGDHECDCWQPMIEQVVGEYGDIDNLPKVTRIWEGPFHSFPYQEEWDEMVSALQEACKRLEIPLDQDELYGERTLPEELRVEAHTQG